jgi:radical SAM protein with 4Fe4S-binding SPASM domain
VSKFAQLCEESARRAIPLTVHLELTLACNVRCVHCFQGPAHRRAPRELSAEEWISIVDQARALGAFFITLSGGEALVSPHFWRVAEHVRRVGLGLRVFSNGIALGRETTRRLAALQPSSVEVTIFSLTPAHHDAVTRVPGSLSRAVRGLFRLRRLGVPLGLKCPLLAESTADHASLRRLAERLGASLVFDPHISPARDGSMAPTRCRGEDGALLSFLTDPATVALEAQPSAPVPPDRSPCGMARTFVSISSEGDVVPCPLLKKTAGNVRDEPLAALWRSPLMEQLRARRYGTLPTCGTCPRSGYCGRCSAIALLEDGDLDGPSSRACHLAELREQAWGIPAPAGAPAAPGRSSLLRVING